MLGASQHQNRHPSNFLLFSLMKLLLDKYFEITSEVLTSVKRTKDSLLKLKGNRMSLTSTSQAIYYDSNLLW